MLGAVLVGDIGRYQRLALRSQHALHRRVGAGKDGRKRAGGRSDRGCRRCLDNVTSRPAITAASAAVRLVFSARDRLDAGEPDLAAVRLGETCAHRSRRRRGPRLAV